MASEQVSDVSNLTALTFPKKASELKAAITYRYQIALDRIGTGPHKFSLPTGNTARTTAVKNNQLALSTTKLCVLIYSNYK